MKMSSFELLPTWILLLGLVIVLIIIKAFIYIKDDERQDLDEKDKKS